jgi:hypothetical protein
MKGMIVNIYRAKGLPDCSNNGLSKQYDTVVLVGEGVPEIFEVKEGVPGVLLKEKTRCGEGYRHYLHAVPIEKQDPNKTGYMFGGCFIYSSDSRFPSRYPIPLHDRQESWEQHQQLGT